MAEELEKIFEVGQEVTPEMILQQLFKRKKVKFHTEISNPLAISCLDTVAKAFSDIPSVSFLIEVWLKSFRINMVSFKRKRATEIVEAFKALLVLELEKKKHLEEAMLGK